MGTGRNGVVMEFWELGFSCNYVRTVHLGNPHMMRLRLLNVNLDNNKNFVIFIELSIPIQAHTNTQCCDVTSADSQIIKKDRNDLSEPGAQPWVQLVYARRENSLITERTEAVDSNVLFLYAGDG